MTSTLYSAQHWFPATYDRGPNWLIWLGLLSTLIAMTSKLWFIGSLSQSAEFIAFILFLYPLARSWHQLHNFFMVRMVFITLLLPIVFFSLHYIESPETAKEFFQLERLVRILIFLPFAWWIGDSERSAFVFYLVVLAGAIIGVILNPEFTISVKNALKGIRVDFGILNWQHTAMYFGLALIGLSVFLPKIASSSKKVRIFLIPLWLIFFVFSVFVVVATQTRATWLALGVCIVLSSIYFIILGFKRRENRKYYIILGGILLVIASLAYLELGDRVTVRFKQELNVIQPILKGNIDDIPENSAGFRLETWIIAFDWIKERPLTGWGAKVRSHAIEFTENTSGYVECCIRHFHNSYIEFTLTFGLLGLAVLISIYFWLVRATIHLVKYQSISKVWGSFVLLATVFFSIVNAFESFLFFWSGVYASAAVFTPVCAMALGNHFHKKELKKL